MFLDTIARRSPDLVRAAIALHQGGAIPPNTYLLDLESIKERITKKTKALAPVHLFGNSCDMKALTEIAQDNKLVIVNDCAQAHGTLYDGKDLGAWKDISCYSFYPTKTMTTGEGGMVTTDDPELNRLGSLIRSHGDDARYHHKLQLLQRRPRPNQTQMHQRPVH